MDVWNTIEEFPGYSISDSGHVRNDETGRNMSVLINQHGVANVGLTKRQVQYKRSIALLVAQAFLPPHPLESFDTPINLDGDRRNNDVHNLMWRPRWFAIRYHNQFDMPTGCSILRPIEDRNSGEIFETSWHAATSWGLLDREIYVAILNNTYVWPTYQHFRIRADTNQ